MASLCSAVVSDDESPTLSIESSMSATSFLILWRTAHASMLTQAKMAGSSSLERFLLAAGVASREGRFSLTCARTFLQGCQMAKFDPFLSLHCTRVEGVGAQSK